MSGLDCLTLVSKTRALNKVDLPSMDMGSKRLGEGSEDRRRQGSATRNIGSEMGTGLGEGLEDRGGLIIAPKMELGVKSMGLGTVSSEVEMRKQLRSNIRKNNNGEIKTHVNR